MKHREAREGHVRTGDSRDATVTRQGAAARGGSRRRKPGPLSRDLLCPAPSFLQLLHEMDAGRTRVCSGTPCSGDPAPLGGGTGQTVTGRSPSTGDNRRPAAVSTSRPFHRSGNQR